MGIGVAGLVAVAASPASATSSANCIKPDSALGLSAKATCLRPAEQAAVQMRLVQTDLMVAALSCNRKSDYNVFAVRYRDELISGGRTLRALFARVHGKRAHSRLNSYITRLANNASMQSLQSNDYCSRMGKLFDGVLAAGPTRFAEFAARFSETGDVELAKRSAQQSESAELIAK